MRLLRYPHTAEFRKPRRDKGRKRGKRILRRAQEEVVRAGSIAGAGGILGAAVGRARGGIQGQKKIKKEARKLRDKEQKLRSYVDGENYKNSDVDREMRPLKEYFARTKDITMRSLQTQGMIRGAKQGLAAGAIAAGGYAAYRGVKALINKRKRKRGRR